MSVELTNGYYKIRPAARLIHTIGSDLIGDSYAALVELVKNSYDADASFVNIIFEYKIIDGQNSLLIKITDDGHGMDFDTVVNKWLVPATNDKLKRKISPEKKRLFQGRKGIGRFAASILGQEMAMTTVDKFGEKTITVIDWRVFNADDFLENVELLVEKVITDENSYTDIEIIAKNETDDEKVSVWDKKTIDELINELRKLISPFKDFDADKFKINLSFINSPVESYNDIAFDIETYPIIDLYDYRISGEIDKGGNFNLVYENNVTDIKQSETIKGNYKLENHGKYCGKLIIDFRVFDREPEAIDNLINKGLIDPVSKKFAGKNEAKRMLNDTYGVNIYKNLFRIRPYGNGGIDWLDLDKERIQNFTLKISNNQIIGFITIEPEELSGLEEKSARDGLKENDHYFGLKELAQKALKELELRRLIFRERSLKSRKVRNTINDSVQNLFSFSSLSKNIETKLEQFNVDKENISQIKSILKQEEENKAELLEDIQKTIAIYQGQATLGKIVSFILHEGRKPVHFFNTEANVIERYVKHYKITKDSDLLDYLDESAKGIRRNSKLISDLFKRITPLAGQKRGHKTDFLVLETIENSYRIFSSTMKDYNIDFSLNCSKSILINGWEEDLFTSITNLIENSIYWLNLYDIENKKIEITVLETVDAVLINFTDNGPGLTDNEIETEIIFEPGYSKKHNGTGLGLAIAGEATDRLNGKLKALKVEKGVYFQIEIDKNE
ncbi:ATP-binding protein [Flavobacterium amniphilum]|uniref:sensor histidine kinase n=1 Tax=Flavobacterium amniphilum TaxID=1834035 RepID=UPI002029DA93|nr:sensor histidine kinase [Flavobacterium amniphilum]MCL9805025.1 ATP-binding protein [Flavobacterium amniphilum]